MDAPTGDQPELDYILSNVTPAQTQPQPQQPAQQQQQQQQQNVPATVTTATTQKDDDSATGSTSNPKKRPLEDKKARDRKRILRNRQLARVSNERRKGRIKAMENELQETKQTVSTLEDSIRCLEEENRELRNLLQGKPTEPTNTAVNPQPQVQSQVQVQVQPGTVVQSNVITGSNPPVQPPG